MGVEKAVKSVWVVSGVYDYEGTPAVAVFDHYPNEAELRQVMNTQYSSLRHFASYEVCEFVLNSTELVDCDKAEVVNYGKN